MGRVIKELEKSSGGNYVVFDDSATVIEGYNKCRAFYKGNRTPNVQN